MTINSSDKITIIERNEDVGESLQVGYKPRNKATSNLGKLCLTDTPQSPPPEKNDDLRIVQI